RRKTSMRTRIRRCALFAAFTVVTLLAAPAAHAACAVPGATSSQALLLSVNSLAFQSGTFGRPGEVETSIVGLWQFSLVSTITTDLPDGTQIHPGDTVDAGYVTWHSDGTELMNSGRPPMTGSFCMGVWKQTPANTTN